MKNYQIIKVNTSTKELESIECDKCGKTYNVYDIDNNILSFSTNFGYGSDFDGNRISFDLCENCLFELLKNVKYILKH